MSVCDTTGEKQWECGKAWQASWRSVFQVRQGLARGSMSASRVAHSVPH